MLAHNVLMSANYSNPSVHVSPELFHHSAFLTKTCHVQVHDTLG